MVVTVYTVEMSLNSGCEKRHFVSDGKGPDIELSSASVAGAVARCCDVRNGCQIASEVAEMWSRHRAIERRFVEVGHSDELDDNHRVQAFVEVGRDETANEGVLFIGLDSEGVARTEATVHRIDAVRQLQTYLAASMP